MITSTQKINPDPLGTVKGRHCITCSGVTTHQDLVIEMEDDNLGTIYREVVSTTCLICGRVIEFLSFLERVKRVRQHIHFARRGEWRPEGGPTA